MRKIKHIENWKKFSNDVHKHIGKTLRGHYQNCKLEPVDFIVDYFGKDFLYSNILKYLCRHKKTGKKQDLCKAAHYLSLLYNLEE